MSARLIWICAGAALACFVALGIVSKTMIEPKGFQIFDASFTGYTLNDAQRFLKALSDEQLAAYQGKFRVLDTVFPVLLTLTYLSFIWQYLVFDLLENAHVAKILSAGIGVQAPLVETAATYTQAKWMCVALSTLVVIWAWRFAAKDVRT